MRSLILITTALVAYIFLRGWPELFVPLIRTCLAVFLLLLGFALWPGRQRDRRAQAWPARRPGFPDYLALGIGVLGI